MYFTNTCITFTSIYIIVNNLVPDLTVPPQDTCAKPSKSTTDSKSSLHRSHLVDH